MMRMRRLPAIAGAMIIAGSALALESGGAAHEAVLAARPDGSVPAWLVAGPFEQSMTGFGRFADIDAIGETTALPSEGKEEVSAMVAGGVAAWRLQSADDRGYLDLNATLGWAPQGSGPEKLVMTKAGYAFCTVESPDDREALLLTGSNSQLRVFLNGKRVCTKDGSRNAVRDTDTMAVRLRRGRNTLLLKIGNTHENFSLTFFGVPAWEWGGYARFTGGDGRPMSDLRFAVGAPAVSGARLISTFFFKRRGSGLDQRVDVDLVSRHPGSRSGSLHLDYARSSVDIPLSDVPFGLSRRSFLIPALASDVPVHGVLVLGNERVGVADTLRAEKRYELHLMLLSHTDIGYTNPQPVVKERHLRTLDHVIEYAARYPDFRWTMETVWPLQEYERSRPRMKFLQLIQLIRSGRVALSPISTNPYTGMVSPEEMLRSLRAGEDYCRIYGLPVRGAVYNDVPGLAWSIPQVLKNRGVSFLACGLNEFMNNYSFQTALPKAFHWSGSDGSTVLTYRTETYVEGMAYGLERNTDVIEHRLWDRIGRLEHNGYGPSMILVNAARGDNADVPIEQFLAAKKWNEEYAYPAFVVSTLNAFADTFTSRYSSSCPTLRGDWTSTWEILFQGEHARMIRERWAQHHLPAAEALATITALVDTNQTPLAGLVQSAYDALLRFSGHGSGLEAGYGTRSENRITMEFREQDIREAQLTAEEVLERAVTRLAAREEDFQTAGAIVFNTMGWKRDGLMSVELKDSSSIQYAVTDLTTGKVVPSYRDGYRLYLVAPGLPSFGFKKFKGEPTGRTVPDRTSDLSVSGDTIASARYRVVLGRGNRPVRSIVSTPNGVELLDEGSPFVFGGLARRHLYGDGAFHPLASRFGRVRILDQRPVRIVAEWRADSGLVDCLRLILWSDADRVDLELTANLSWLREPATAEEYCVPFPVAALRPSVRMETVAGFLDPAADRLPGSAHNGYSLQRCIGISDSGLAATIVSVDSRVVFLESDAARGRAAVMANIVNNFPSSWNRNEEGSGRPCYRFSIQGHRGPFDPGAAARLGWEAATDPIAKNTFLKNSPPETSFVRVSSGSVILSAFGSTGAGGGFFMRLVNTSFAGPGRVEVRSDLLKPFRIERKGPGSAGLTLAGPGADAFTLDLGPNETATILLEEGQNIPPPHNE
jgi:hypothetical protein